MQQSLAADVPPASATVHTDTSGLAPDLVPYVAGYDWQRRIHADVVAGTRPPTLLLLEHEAVYTAGRRTEPHEFPRDGSAVVPVDRGGKITWHGPGQLVGYPIHRLPDPVDVVDFVRRLEGALIRVLSVHGVDGRRIDGRSGVWVRHGGTDRKLAAIGIRVEQGATLHGFAVNCDNSLAPFDQIVPCGISDAGVTTVSEAAGRHLAPADLVDDVTREVSAIIARAHA